METNPTPLQRVLKAAGINEAELARRVGVRPQAVSKWNRKIPPDRVLELERMCGGAVTRHDMRPDVFGPAEVETH